MAKRSEPDDRLPPAETARALRRDRDTSAAARKGMRTGLAKQLKQVLDAQAKRAREVGRRDGARRPGEQPEPDPEQPGTASR